MIPVRGGGKLGRGLRARARNLMFVLECHSLTTSTNKKIDLLLSPHPQPFSQKEKGEELPLQ
jgi:hypothetical protein